MHFFPSLSLSLSLSLKTVPKRPDSDKITLTKAFYECRFFGTYIFVWTPLLYYIAIYDMNDDEKKFTDLNWFESTIHTVQCESEVDLTLYLAIPFV